MKAEADAAAAKAKAKAEADAVKAKEEATRADAARARQAAAALRTQLFEQTQPHFGNFDFGKYDLRPEAREKLAKPSGVILAHPGLNLAIEGHTDNVGTNEIDRKLSEQRAESVRSYLIEQGLALTSLSAKGFGEIVPVANNSTSSGRQRNRRVEIDVSGEAIGVKIGS